MVALVTNHSHLQVPWGDQGFRINNNEVADRIEVYWNPWKVFMD